MGGRGERIEVGVDGAAEEVKEITAHKSFFKC